MFFPFYRLSSSVRLHKVCNFTLLSQVVHARLPVFLPALVIGLALRMCASMCPVSEPFGEDTESALKHNGLQKRPGQRGKLLVAMSALRLPHKTLSFSRIGGAYFKVRCDPAVEIGDVVEHAPADLRKARALAAAPELVQG